MKRWLIIVAVIFLVLAPTKAFAETTADVTVTATGYVCGAPSLTVTWISDTEIQLDWIKGADADNTMIRAKIGSPPSNRNDGYQVYYGNGTTASDTFVNLDEIGTLVYYHAWSQNAGGIWEEYGDSGFIGGQGVILIAILMLCIAATYFSLKSSNIWLAFLCALPWIFLWVYTRENPIGGVTEGGFADEVTMYIGLGFALFLPAMAIGRRSRERKYSGEAGVSPEWGESRQIVPTKRVEMSSTDAYRQQMRVAVRRRRR